MGHAGVVAQLFHRVLAFLRRAGDADHAAALDLGNLPHHRSNRTGGSRKHHGFTGPGLADIQQAHVGSKAGHTQHTQRVGYRLYARIQLHQARPIGQGVLLPAGEGRDQVARGKVRMIGGDHLGHGAAHHHLTQFHPVSIAVARGHPTAHVGVQREVAGFQQ